MPEIKGRISQKADTAEHWKLYNPLIKPYELIFYTDKKKFKLGGATATKAEDLPFYEPDLAQTTGTATDVAMSQKATTDAINAAIFTALNTSI